jgi:3-oxoacid CoA-transferase
MNLVNAVRTSGVKDITIASNSCGVDGKDLQTDWGLSMLLRTRQIKRLIFSHLGENVESQRQYFNGEIELEVCPQGTLAEKIRAGGSGIPAFYTATGVDTIVEHGGYVIKYKKNADGSITPEIVSAPKPVKVFKGKKYLEE